MTLPTASQIVAASTRRDYYYRQAMRSIVLWLLRAVGVLIFSMVTGYAIALAPTDIFLGWILCVAGAVVYLLVRKQ
jgi:ABC-type glycerol-3-phosphate transport system permease component